MSVEFAKVSFARSNTPFSQKFDDPYFSFDNGIAETQYVFIEGNNLFERFLAHKESFFVIAESGFGTGLNFFVTANVFEKFRKEYPNHTLKRLYFISFEKYPILKQDLANILQYYDEITPLTQTFLEQYQIFHNGSHRFIFDNIYLDLHIGDILENLPKLDDNFNNKVDAWFLDGFAPSKNPQMWNDTLFENIYRLTKNNGSFATFTAAGAVRRSLEQVGFKVSKRKGFGRKREMLCGVKESSSLHLQYPEYYQEVQDDISDVAIIGGGVATFFTTNYLLSKGIKVTIYCKDDRLYKNASGNKIGAFYAQLSDDDPVNVSFNISAFDFAVKEYQKLKELFDFTIDLSGVALIGYNDKNIKKNEKLFAQNYPSDLFKRLEKNEILQKVGINLPLEHYNVGFFEKGGYLSPRDFMEKAFAYLETQGVEIHLNSKLLDIKPNKEGNRLIFEDRSIHHQSVVLACGHHLKEFEGLNSVPFYPIRGQVSETFANERLKELKSVLCADAYLTPMVKNLNILGASHKRDNDNFDFSMQEQEQNFEKIEHNLGLALNRSETGRVAIRCALRDRMPCVGLVANFEKQKDQFNKLFELKRRNKPIEQAVFFKNIFVIGALGSRGFTTAPLCSQILASQIAKEIAPVDSEIIRYLSSNRSWIRKMRKGVQF